MLFDLDFQMKYVNIICCNIYRSVENAPFNDTVWVGFTFSLYGGIIHQIGTRLLLV